MRAPESPHVRQILKEATTPLVDLRLLRSERGDEIKRQNCPDGQFYLVTRGLWHFKEEGPATHLGTMGFSYSAPGQPCLRTAEETVIAFGLQVRPKALSRSFEKPLQSKDDKTMDWNFKRAYLRVMKSFVADKDPADIEDEIILLLSSEPITTEKRIPKWLKTARDLLHEQANDFQSLSSIAQAIGITPSHLSSSFKSALGVSFATYRRRVKIERALGHAASQGLSMNAAAIAAGFYDASHFYRACQAELGIGPALLNKVLQATKIDNLYKTSA